MLNKLRPLFLAIIIIFSLNYISAGLSVTPSTIELEGTAEINIDLLNYNNYLYFYQLGAVSPLGIVIDLGCGDSCTANQKFNYVFNSGSFPVGTYKVAVFSRDTNQWVYADFEIVEEVVASSFCSDGTLSGFCSILTKPKYCESGNFINDCQTCGCSFGKTCQSDGSCVSSSDSSSDSCSDGTLFNQCSYTKPLFCNSDGNLVNKCNFCGCIEGYICDVKDESCFNYGECYDNTPVGECSTSTGKTLLL
jgi:hypothetical protein